jgi:hypothetical protein
VNVKASFGDFYITLDFDVMPLDHSLDSFSVDIQESYGSLFSPFGMIEFP